MLGRNLSRYESTGDLLMLTTVVHGCTHVSMQMPCEHVIVEPDKS